MGCVFESGLGSSGCCQLVEDTVTGCEPCNPALLLGIVCCTCTLAAVGWKVKLAANFTSSCLQRWQRTLSAQIVPYRNQCGCWFCWTGACTACACPAHQRRSITCILQQCTERASSEWRCLNWLGNKHAAHLQRWLLLPCRVALFSCHCKNMSNRNWYY